MQADYNWIDTVASTYMRVYYNEIVSDTLTNVWVN